ncbi:DNA topoisomerase 3 [Paenibacillus pasadenensis]|uniref:type IA DNA topoisomerase n=1 Tax=Paenibacillus pasadenensis TaxID=217090 RepID=UPI00203DD704|nr:type IA DNA topoisomerase [Paenibacillus pasadenensis]MCM3748919.1 DNA topoisomerase 3 [Paenibacillus pasadenensis]
MKTLIIAEKPDMGRTIAAVMEPKASNRRTHLEGERFIITWAIGHLVGLAEPDDYDPKYKKWQDADLPIIPDSFKLSPNPRTKDQLKVISELARHCGRIVNACDAGREGQLIFHLIRRHLKLKQPVDRLWISDLTPETIRRGFQQLASDEKYAPLTRAAQARSEADWLIGMNASRAFTIRHRTLLSVGRVQTPVLALLYDRFKEIEAFKSETYYRIEAQFEQKPVKYKGVWQGDRLTDGAKAQAIAEKVKGKPGRISSYETAEAKEYPFRLHDLTLLQREANGRYGFPAKKTLDLAQALYEKHKVITYPRTNSNYVTEETIPVMTKTLDMLRGTEYAELAAGADRFKVHKGNKAVCNPSKVEDHHAILPTPKKPGTLNTDEKKVYDLIVRRFLSHYYGPAVYRNHTVLTIVEEETFRTRIKQLLDPGWKVTQGQSDAEEGKKSRSKTKKDEDEEEEQLLTDVDFSVDSNTPVVCKSAKAEEKATQPPKPYTEGTLLKAMESAGKSMEDEELRETMKDSGLGTPATRAATIERLKQVGYIHTAGKKLEIEPKGIAAIELIRGAGVELLASPMMTGQWERRLVQIARDEASDEAFMDKVKQFARHIVEKVRLQPPAPAGTFQEPERSGGRGGTRKGKQRQAGATANKSAGKTYAASRNGSGGSRTVKTSASAKPVRTEQGYSSAADHAGYGESVRTSSAAANQAFPAARGAALDTRASVQATSRPAASSGGLKPLGACPSPGCSGAVIEGKRGFGCSRFKEGCRFVIWKEQHGKKLSLPMLQSLLGKGQTSLLTFTAANGQSVKGRLLLQQPYNGVLKLVTD